MDATWLDLGGLRLYHTVNAGTNMLLTAQCIACGLLMRRLPEHSARAWSAFFYLSAAATGAGIIKHGFGPEIGAGTYAAVLAITNVCSGLSTYFAQRATIRAHVRSNRQPMLEAAIALQAMVFLFANAVLGPELFLMIINSAVGLVPVMVTETIAARTGDRGASSIAGGFAISMLAGFAYIADVSAGPWFDHVDVAHAVMAVSFYMIARGVMQRTASVPSTGRAACPT